MRALRPVLFTLVLVAGSVLGSPSRADLADIDVTLPPLPRLIGQAGDSGPGPLPVTRVASVPSFNFGELLLSAADDSVGLFALGDPDSFYAPAGTPENPATLAGFSLPASNARDLVAGVNFGSETVFALTEDPPASPPGSFAISGRTPAAGSGSRPTAPGLPAWRTAGSGCARPETGFRKTRWVECSPTTGGSG